MSPLALLAWRIRPLSWSPVTESNRRPSPYHGSMNGLIGPGTTSDQVVRSQTPAESGLWDFQLLRCFRTVRLDLAGQRLTSGTESALTPWNASEALGAVFMPKAPPWWQRWISQASGV